MERNDQAHRDSVAQWRQEINEDLMIDEDQLYAGPRGQLRQWFDEGGIDNADYMIVGSDTFDNTLFPVYTNAGVESTTEAVTRLQAGGNRAMEVYDLHADRESQILAPRAWNNEEVSRETAVPQGASSQAGLSSFKGGRTLPSAPAPGQPTATVAPGISSQAGLGTFRSRVRNLPSVPSPGQPGSRFSPVVVSREEQAARGFAGTESKTPAGAKAVPGARGKGAGKKSLDIGMPPGMIQGVPPEILNPGGAEKQEQGVVGASAQGFVGGVMAGAQMNMGSGTPEVPGQDDDASADTKEDAGTSVKAARPAVAHANKVVMNPKHVAGLQSLAGQQHDQLEGAGSRYGH